MIRYSEICSKFPGEHQALDLQLKLAPSKVFLKYFDHRFTRLLFKTHIFQNTYFLKTPPVAAPLKRYCYDNV